MRHNVGVNVLEHLERTGDRPASLLLQVHEDTPCAMCRYSTAKLLAEALETPHWMAQEWRHDVSEELRELASSPSPADPELPWYGQHAQSRH